MTRIRKALVIGGGIAGPVTAMALRKAGIDATVYEAYDSTADGVGGILSIASNGQNALAVLDAADAIQRIGTPVEAMIMESWTGKALGEFGTLPGLPPMLTIWRGELNRALYDEAAARGIPFEYGKRLVGIEDDDNDTKVTARFADGTTAEGDILIAADGIRSTTRSLIDADAPEPRYAGMLGFGAMVADTGLPSTRGKMHMAFGKRAFLGYQVYDDGSGGYFVNLPHAPMMSAEAKAVDPAEWLRICADHFRGDRLPALDLLRRTDPANLIVTGALEDLPNVRTWSRGRVVLVGDAAHATSPSSGQGASMAIESAIILARCLRDLPYEQAFARYAELRRERVAKVIAAGARTNQSKAAGPVARVIRDVTMPLLMRFAKPDMFAWQFAYRIDWDESASTSQVVAP